MNTLARLPELLGLGFLVLFVAAVFTPLSNVLAESVTVPPEIAPADAIVVLAADGVSSSGALSDVSLRRTVVGIDLYQRGLAPLLVFSGGAVERSRSESQIRADMARKFGIPPRGILTSAGAHTTREEAVRVKSLLWPRAARKILLVTHAQHMKRAAAVFEHVGFRVLAAPASEPERHLDPAGRLGLMRATLREIVALVYYRIAGYL
jgi:uncharacterized SAM-binding protein YcdF (DUF218 family)